MLSRLSRTSPTSFETLIDFMLVLKLRYPQSDEPVLRFALFITFSLNTIHVTVELSVSSMAIRNIHGNICMLLDCKQTIKVWDLENLQLGAALYMQVSLQY